MEHANQLTAQKCANCSTQTTNLIKCPSCDTVSYCGAQCMKQHRPQHKKVCRKINKKKPKGQGTAKVAENVRFKGKEVSYNYYCLMSGVCVF